MLWLLVAADRHVNLNILSSRCFYVRHEGNFALVQYRVHKALSLNFNFIPILASTKEFWELEVTFDPAGNTATTLVPIGLLYSV